MTLPPLPKLMNATPYQQEQVELYAKAYAAAVRAATIEEVAQLAESKQGYWGVLELPAAIRALKEQK